MPTTTSAPATLDDLYRVEGKAELVAGRIIHQVASGFDPSWTALEISVSLRQHARDLGIGYGLADGFGFALHPPLSNGRQSFSPNACYYLGKRPIRGMRFIDGVPAFAVEVRSENDYGPATEAAMQAKRADYFEAGTTVVWDVDPETKVVQSYRSDPASPVATFRPGDTADAEPAVPGWRVPVDDLFQ